MEFVNYVVFGGAVGIYACIASVSVRRAEGEQTRARILGEQPYLEGRLAAFFFGDPRRSSERNILREDNEQG